MKALLRKIRQILKDRRTRRFLTRFVSGVAAIVVFVTTYALVLPAITMESEAACGIEAHQHDDSCYSENLICGQEHGTKAEHIQFSTENKYESDCILMVGDAPGDRDAAASNGVCYFPILVNQEGESWAELKHTALDKLRDGTYAGDYQDTKIKQFLQNLGG